MSVKGVKLKSESYFSISPGVLELRRENLRGVDSPPVQIGLMAVVSSIANLALEADKNSQTVDTKQIVTHVLNATTLLGCAHQKLNNRRKESIASVLPKEIRKVCSSQREVTSWPFGDDLAQAIKEAKEMNKLSNEIATGKKYSKRQFQNPRSIQSQGGYKRPQINLRHQLNKARAFNRAGNPVTGRSQNTLN